MKKSVLAILVFSATQMIASAAFAQSSATSSVVGSDSGDGGQSGSYEHVAVAVTDANGPVAGAKCVLSNDKGSWNVSAPDTASIRRSSSDLKVECSKDGYEVASGTIPAGKTQITPKRFQFSTDSGGDGEEDADVTVPQYSPTIKVTLTSKSPAQTQAAN